MSGLRNSAKIAWHAKRQNLTVTRFMTMVDPDNAFRDQINESRLRALRIKARTRFALQCLRNAAKLFLLLGKKRIVGRRPLSGRRNRAHANIVGRLHYRSWMNSP